MAERDPKPSSLFLSLPPPQTPSETRESLFPVSFDSSTPDPHVELTEDLSTFSSRVLASPIPLFDDLRREGGSWISTELVRILKESIIQFVVLIDK